jgi:amino acid adenylation domain-containing protein
VALQWRGRCSSGDADRGAAAERDGRIGGLFVNTLVLRVPVRGAESFVELLGAVKEAALGGYGHQEVPFEKLVEELEPERSLSYSPLFQVMFAWQVNMLPELQLAGVAVRQRQLRSETAKFDLTLQLEEAEGGVRGWLEYNTDLFATESMKRLLGHYESLLWGVVRHPSQRLAELPLLGEQERRQLLEEWNQTRRAYPSRACIHELFAAQAKAHADEVAVVCGEAALSYGELNRRANQLARHLRRLGVGPEEVVGICMDGSLELVVGLLGILKTGGAYLPLDPSYPPKRLRFMVQDAGVRVVLTTKGLTPVPDETGVRLVYLDTGWEAIAEESAAALENSSTADNLAYITYTSGSSGEPKGVGVVHRGVVRLVQQNSYAVLDEGEVFLHLAPLSFDASTFEIWGSLLNGARLVVMTAGPPSLMEIGAALEQYGVTTLWLTAGLFNLMVEERPAELRCLRQLLAGGDVLSMVHVERFLQEASGCTLINGYGPTENTTFTCTYAMKGPMQFEASVPIGRAIANTEVYVLDRELQPVPVGVVGELYLGGAGLARGYQGQAALTAERFVPHPYGREGGVRLYRTGDLGRYRGDGVLEFVGRVDQQVKLRGYRIELGEIESVLREHERVAEAVVVVRDAGAEKQLVGYVVAAKGGSGELRVAELREYLGEQVPHYMIPGALVVLERLPLTANGKIDRRALPEVERRSGSGGEERERTETETAVARIWEEVLGVEQVGLADNFFELGGHSLLAIRIVSRVREAFDVDLSLRTLFESQTIEAIGRVIEESKKNGKHTRAPVIRAVSRERYRSKAPVP